jgi:MSHA pilin protein MshA
MRNQNGFTLIELVVVIVILGILSAIAIPKFIDMQVDARQSAVSGMRAAVQSASALAHAQYLVDGSTGTTVEMEGDDVAITEGYPSAAEGGIDEAVNMDGFFFVAGTGTTAAYFYLGDEDDDPDTDCRVSYVEAATGGSPVIDVDDACL